MDIDYSLNYSTTTTTVDTSNWHKVRVTGLLGLWTIHDWVRNNKDELAGGYMIDGNRLFLQNAKDVTFFKLTVDGNLSD